MKNKWESIKWDYTAWETLKQCASSLGIDPETGSIVANDAWWAHAIVTGVTKFYFCKESRLDVGGFQLPSLLRGMLSSVYLACGKKIQFFGSASTNIHASMISVWSQSRNNMHKIGKDVQRCSSRRLGLGARALAVASRSDGATVSKPNRGDFCKKAKTEMGRDDALYMP